MSAILLHVLGRDTSVLAVLCLLSSSISAFPSICPSSWSLSLEVAWKLKIYWPRTGAYRSLRTTNCSNIFVFIALLPHVTSFRSMWRRPAVTRSDFTASYIVLGIQPYGIYVFRASHSSYLAEKFAWQSLEKTWKRTHFQAPQTLDSQDARLTRYDRFELSEVHSVSIRRTIGHCGNYIATVEDSTRLNFGCCSHIYEQTVPPVQPESLKNAAGSIYQYCSARGRNLLEHT
ncbi:uncharacterized protein BT62DRAFT_1004997 [Guyanagaster necrorhizus]|uniref:Uncharacterized protein n=1 Tax=Guyanagaster necrorhizus TaxID=856835 RepID=A0A9P8ATG6_9AGAR|nr:uncharacterized protein BT62DRAFT_1004997 [Guyanagaster necrorhizus MCA 3950]KAG7447394.1 hypothetical protein BT62DRAFT_1004997 [Guyanagaster necrorhizus MCA 3950]